MKNTKNYNLQKPDMNNIADIEVLNDNFDKIDNGITPFYVATLESTNTYKITTGINKTSLSDGYSIRVAIPSDSNGAVSIKVDDVTVPVKKPNSNPVTNFKQNGVYNLTYYNSVFILASGGVDEVNFSTSDLLSGKTANNSDGEKVTGTMPNIGQQTATINAGGKVTISKGYHDGTGYIQSNSMGKQLSDLGSTLTSASQLISGVKAVDKTGKLITGTATIQSLGGVPVKKIVGKAHFEATSGSYSMFHPQIDVDYKFILGYFYWTASGDSTLSNRKYFYISKEFYDASSYKYLTCTLPKSTNKSECSYTSAFSNWLCSNKTDINTYQLLNNPRICASTWALSNGTPTDDITVVSNIYM